MRSPKTIASAALLSLVSAASLPDTPHFYLYDLSSPTIAVVDFHNQGISLAAGQTLTERFRLTLSMYTPYSVEASGIENRFNILNKISRNYSTCTSIDCAVNVGKLLNVDRIVMGNVSRESNQYTLSAELISVQMEEIIRSRTLEYVGELDGIHDYVDTLVTKLFYDELNPILYASRFLVTSDGLALRQTSFPQLESKIDLELERNEVLWAMLYSAALPGSGQVYSKRVVIGRRIIGGWATLGGLMVYNYYQYSTSKKEADRLYASYGQSLIPEDLLAYRPKIQRYGRRIDRANRNMRIIRNFSVIYWLGNMWHTWQVAPRKIEIEPSSILLTMDPVLNEIGFVLSVALN
ncbi:MAG: DUF5683 domain-containing protein [Candidatus Neomarinimicrobiota bacterium]|nr:DUF5683 domain-containing protein [Candidatus Neomarinimicrobiota bacterium]